MKAWRRTASDTAPQAAQGGPLIVSIVATGDIEVTVNFDQPTTLSSNTTSLTLEDDPMAWTELPGTRVVWHAYSQGANAHYSGEAWSMPGPEPEMTPAPVLPQSGLTT